MGTIAGMKPIERPPQPERRDAGSEPLAPDLTPRKEPRVTKIAGPPWYGRAWLAYVMGAIITAGGGLWAWDKTHYLGVGIIALCGGYMSWAGIERVRATGRGTWIDAILEAIRAALEALEKWIKKHMEA